MQVILLEKIRHLGSLGDQVKVKAGYARNFLIPQGKAVFASAENLAEFAARNAELEQKATMLLQAAQKKATEINALSTIMLTVHASEEGKLFGSIGVRDIVAAVSAKGVVLEKHQVKLPQGRIDEIGQYDVDISLHSDVTEKVTVALIANK